MTNGDEAMHSNFRSQNSGCNGLLTSAAGVRIQSNGFGAPLWQETGRERRNGRERRSRGAKIVYQKFLTYNFAKNIVLLHEVTWRPLERVCAKSLSKSAIKSTSSQARPAGVGSLIYGVEWLRNPMKVTLRLAYAYMRICARHGIPQPNTRLHRHMC